MASSWQPASFVSYEPVVRGREEVSSSLRLPRLLYYAGMALVGELVFRPVNNFTLSDIFFLSSLAVLGLVLLLLRARSEVSGRNQGQLSTMLVYGVVVFTLGGVFSSVTSRHPLASLGVVARFAYLTVVWFWLGGVLLRTLNQVLIAIWLWVASTAVTSLAAVGQLSGVIPHPLFNGRLTGFTEHPNDLGAIAAIALVPAVFLMTRPRASAAARAAAVVVVCSSMAGLSLSGSIGALLALAGAWVLWLVLSPDRKRHLVATGIVVVALGIWSGTQDVSQRYSPLSRVSDVTGYGYSELGTAESRVYIDQAALQRISHNPLLGDGLDTDTQVEEFGDLVHNMLLLVWFGGGLFAALGLLMILISTSVTAYSTVRSAPSEQERSVAVALSSALTAFLLVSIWQPVVFVRYGWLPAALLTALRGTQLHRARSMLAPLPRVPVHARAIPRGADVGGRQEASRFEPYALLQTGHNGGEDSAGSSVAHLARQRDATSVDPEMAYEHGVLLEDQGRDAEAEEWYRRAATVGHGAAANSLALLLEKSGQGDEAEAWYRDAVERGNVDGAYNLGLLLEERGADCEAREWYRRAAEAGDAAGAYRLASLLEQHEAGEEAREWYSRAANAGHSGAANGLGLLLDRQGISEEAENWYRRAAEAGDPDAAYNLGLTLKRRRAWREAEAWFRRAANMNDSESAYQFAVLLEARGEQVEADGWYVRAATTGNLDSSYYLGLLREERGDSAEAQCWYRRAAGGGHLAAAKRLRGLSVSG